MAVGAAILEAVAIIILSLALVATRSTTSAPIGSTIGPSGSFGQHSGKVVYASSFGASQGWDTGLVNANTDITLSNGQYRVTGWTRVHHALLTPYGVPQGGMSIETGATDYPNENVSLGVGCQSASGISPSLVYQLVTYPDGQWYVEEARVPGAVETLLSGTTAPLGTAVSLQLTCVITASTSGAETTQLAGYVDGIKVGAIGDQIHQQVGGYVPVLVFGTYGPRVSATFTGVTVREIRPH
ncbi:MAG: hypothetical protein ABSC30_07005 [Acidimicrobiales bacterium]